MIERVLHGTGLLALAIALALALVVPEIVVQGWGHPQLPGLVHLATLGALLSLAYALQQRLWRGLYGERGPWTPLLWAAWALHVPGVLLLVWGLLWLNPRLAYWGGHYLVPSGIVLALVHGVVAAWRRPQGTPRRLAAHLPGLGLAVAMSLGALLVMEASQPRWALYSLDTILAHLLAAGFLFVLPLLLLPEAVLGASGKPPAMAGASGKPPAVPCASGKPPAMAGASGKPPAMAGASGEPPAMAGASGEPPAMAGASGKPPAMAGASGKPPAPFAALLRWYAATAIGAGGVLLVVLALGGSGPPRLFTIALAMLGALLVWLGLPSAEQLAGRPGRSLRAVVLVPLAGRLATGVLLFYAALRYARGTQPGDGLWLAKVGVLLFLTGVALPELLVHLERLSGAAGANAALRRQALWLAGSAALLAGQLWVQTWLVQAGALAWLAGLGWHGVARLRER
jgi:hypothetical protein